MSALGMAFSNRMQTAAGEECPPSLSLIQAAVLVVMKACLMEFLSCRSLLRVWYAFFVDDQNCICTVLRKG